MSDNQTVEGTREFRVARDLCADGGHPEYVRACANMVAELTALDQESHDALVAALNGGQGSS